ncbi:coactosin-like protein [Tubulanus polymorphus]|uniref:coactosin-like protein n=1 Tax=Tubulanus polymorphus TaxID=672921 RepID=UPI003DA426DF
MSAQLFEDQDAVNAAYEDVRSDSTSTTWVILEYNDKKLYISATGDDYDECMKHLDETKRAYVYIRLIVGDELSKRPKFAFISWIGFDVPPLKKARVSTDKSFVKSIFQSFAKEFLCSEKADLLESNIRKGIEKAGGANYGIGK